MNLFDRRKAPQRTETWFLYALVDSRKQQDIRYIGITNNPRSRLSLHVSQSSKEGWRKSRWIQSVIADGGEILMGILESGLDQTSAMAKEVLLIAEHRAVGGRLTNLTDGGEGVKGQVQSAETRAKKSAALTGKKKPAGHGANVSKAKVGIKLSDGTRANMSAAHIERYKSPAARQRQRDGTIARFEDLNERARYADLTRMRFERDGERERHAQNMRRVANDNPDIGERRKSSQRSNGPQSNSKTGLKGVFLDGSRGKFCARIRVDGKTTHLGYFTTSDEAAVAYDKASRAHFGSAAYTNFPHSLQLAA